METSYEYFTEQTRYTWVVLFGELSVSTVHECNHKLQFSTSRSTCWLFDPFEDMTGIERFRSICRQILGWTHKVLSSLFKAISKFSRVIFAVVWSNTKLYETENYGALRWPTNDVASSSHVVIVRCKPNLNTTYTNSFIRYLMLWYVQK